MGNSTDIDQLSPELSTGTQASRKTITAACRATRFASKIPTDLPAPQAAGNWAGHPAPGPMPVTYTAETSRCFH